MKAKRVLAILLSLTLLIGLIPVAGLVASGVAAETATAVDSQVSKYMFLGQGEYFGLGQFNQHGVGVTQAMRDKAAAEGGMTYTLSFEYYLFDYNEGLTTFKYSDVAGTCTVTGGSDALRTGRGRFEITVKGTNADGHYQIVPRFTFETGNIAELYIWDLKVVVQGVEIGTYIDGDATYKTTPSETDTLANYTAAGSIIDSPTVTELDFTASQLNYGPATYSVYGGLVPSDVRTAILNGTVDAEYTISFDYYLPVDTQINLGSIDGNFSQKNDVLTHGMIYSYKETFKVGSGNNYQFAPRLTAAAAGKLYIWNWKVELCGNVVTKSAAFTNDAYTAGTATKTLADYAWGPNTDGTYDELTYYVSASGSDDADGSEATPFATLGKAYGLISSNIDYLAGRVVVIGELAPDSGASSTNTKPVTLTGKDSSASLNISAATNYFVFPGTKFENIAFIVKSDGSRLCANQKDFSIGEGVTYDLTNTQIVTGDGWSSSYVYAGAEPIDIEVDSGTYSAVQIGHYGHHKGVSREHGAANVVINGGTVSKIQVGSVGLSWHDDLKGATDYKGDINVVVNGGTIGSAVIGDTSVAEGTASTLNGHAVTMIFNNGTGNQLTATPALADAEALGGTLYLLKAAAAAEMQILPTDEAGTFRVIGERDAIVMNGDTEVTRSENGVFTIQPGVYDIQWTKLPGTQSIYIDDTGVDAEADGTSLKPYKTLDAARAAAELSEYQNVEIVVMTSLTISASSAYAPAKKQYYVPVTIRGANVSSMIAVSSSYYHFYGPTTIKGITLNVTSDNILLDNQNVTIASDVTVTGNAPSVHFGDYNRTDQADIFHPTVMNVNVASGAYGNVTLANMVAHGGVANAMKIPGINFTFSGTSISQLRVGAREGWGALSNAGGSDYQGDVNVVVNGGSVGSVYVGDTTSIKAASKFNGHNIQIVLNNGAGAALVAKPTLADAQEHDGVLYFLNVAAAAGSYLELTDTVGTYKVIGDRDAIVKVDGEEIARSTNGELTVAPGAYDIEWTKAVGTVSVYVDSTSGNDGTGDGSFDNPYQTLRKALAALESSDYQNNEIILKTSYTTTNRWEMTSDGTSGTRFTTQYKTPVVIKGLTSDVALTVNAGYLDFFGPVTFSGMHLNVNDGTHLVLSNQNVTIAKDVVMGANKPSVHFGEYNRTTQADIYTPAKMSVELSTGAYKNIVLANMVPHGGVANAMKIPGINFVANDITANSLRVGATEGWGDLSNAGGSDYQGDVSVVVNGGTVGALYVGDSTSIKAASNFNGNDIQIILNGGAGSALSAKPTLADAQAVNGVLYFLNVAKADGSYLELTETPGTYKVIGDREALILVDGEEVARSADGYLTIEPGAYEIGWTRAKGTMSVYVDDLGSDETGDGSKDNPFKTLKKAFTVTETSDYETTEIVIKSSYTTTNQYDMGANGVSYRVESTVYKVPVIIRGETAAATFTVNADYFQFYGPTTFENIHLNFNASTNIMLNDQHVAIGEGVVLGSNKPNIYFGDYNRTTQNEIYTPTTMRVSLAAGAYNQINLSNLVPHGGSTVPQGRRIPGINFVASNITANYITLGGRQGWGDGANGGSSYQGDVDIIINGGSIANFAIADVSSIASTGLSDFNGHTVTAIFNGGAGATLVTKPTLADVTKLNGTLYFLNVAAANGSYIEKTDVAGQFAVVGNRDAIVCDASGNELTRSVNGLLTLDPGVYEIGWTPILGTQTVYVDDAGNDETGDGSFDKPFKTFRKALTVTEQDVYVRQEIVIKNAFTADEYAFTNDGTSSTRWTTKYNNHVVIRGASPEVVLTVNAKRLHFYGPTTLESLTLSTYASESTTFLADSRDVTFGDGITYLNQSYVPGTGLCRPNLYAGSYNYTAYNYTDCFSTDKMNLTVNGDFLNVTLAQMVPHGGNGETPMKLPGVNFTMNGGSLYVLRVGGMDGFGDVSNSGGTSFQGDVNITLNGGHIGGNNGGGIYIGDTSAIKTASTLNGHNVQIIFNNGTYIGDKDNIPTQEDVTAMGGNSLYIIETIAKEGCGLEVTDVAGVYNITGGAIARAYNVDTHQVVSSVDGKLTVTAGEWRVTFNTTLAELEQPESIDGKLFVGWTDANGDLYSGDTLWTADMVLDEKWNLGDFANDIQASLREPSNVDKVALRYELSYDKSLIEGIPEEDVIFGAVLIPEIMRNGKELTLGATYTYKNKVYSAQGVDATKVLAKSLEEGATKTYYSINLININTWGYKKPYAIRGYVTFTNANGITHTVYSDEVIAANLYQTAEGLRDAAAEAEKAPFNTLIAASDAKVYGSTVTNGNKPIPSTVNTATMYDKHSSSMDAQAEALLETVLHNTTSTVFASSKGNGGTVYYLSYKGNDSNDGLTSATAMKTTKALQDKYTFKSGDVILFERDGVYRDVTLEFAGKYVSVGVYGSGDKPQLYAGDKNYIDATWTLTGTPNVWKVAITHEQNAIGSEWSSALDDIGNIVFDYGNALASPGKKMKLDALAENYDFYYDAATKSLYLYFALGNPAEYHNSIEICPNEAIIQYRGALGSGTSGITSATVENLTMKYSGGHGVSTAKANNVNVRGCEIGYMGGSMLNCEGDTDVDGDGKVENVRYGNGIELFAPVTGGTIENNWIYQCFDAGYTNQGGNTDSPLIHKDLTVQNNLIEYCVYNIEVWAAQDTGESAPQLQNVKYQNNILRFAGYGFGTYNRIGSSTVVVGNISFYTYNISCDSNTVISGNILDGSYRYLVCIINPNVAGKSPTITGNTWVQTPYSRAASKFDNLGTTAAVGRGEYYKDEDGNNILVNGLATYPLYGCSTLEEMQASVARYDTAPVSVVLE